MVIFQQYPPDGRKTPELQFIIHIFKTNNELQLSLSWLLECRWYASSMLYTTLMNSPTDLNSSHYQIWNFQLCHFASRPNVTTKVPTPHSPVYIWQTSRYTHRQRSDFCQIENSITWILLTWVWSVLPPPGRRSRYKVYINSTCSESRTRSTAFLSK